MTGKMSDIKTLHCVQKKRNLTRLETHSVFLYGLQELGFRIRTYLFLCVNHYENMNIKRHGYTLISNYETKPVILIHRHLNVLTLARRFLHGFYSAPNMFQELIKNAL